MGTPCNEYPCSDEKDRDSVFMKVGSTYNILVNQGRKGQGESEK